MKACFMKYYACSKGIRKSFGEYFGVLTLDVDCFWLIWLALVMTLPWVPLVLRFCSFDSVNSNSLSLLLIKYELSKFL